MKVVGKQKNSKNCIICGLYNDAGLKAPFYELEDGRVATVFKYDFKHQSYPGRVHGGMICCMLDEIAGRTLWVKEPKRVGVTTNLSIKYRRPVPYGTTLYATGEMIKEGRHGFTAASKIVDADGVVLAEAEVTYLKLDWEQVTDADVHEELDEYVEDGVNELPL